MSQSIAVQALLKPMFKTIGHWFLLWANVRHEVVARRASLSLPKPGDPPTLPSGQQLSDPSSTSSDSRQTTQCTASSPAPGLYSNAYFWYSLPFVPNYGSGSSLQIAPVGTGPPVYPLGKLILGSGVCSEIVVRVVPNIKRKQPW